MLKEKLVGKAVDIAKRNIEIGHIPARRVIFDGAYPLSYSRWKLWQMAETPWFVNLDDDVILGENWFEKLSSKIDENTIAVEGMLGDTFRDTFNHYKGRYIPSKDAWALDRGKRGFIWNTLLKTEVFKKWNLKKIVEESEELQIIDFLKPIKGDWLRVPIEGQHEGNFERSALACGSGWIQNRGAGAAVQFGKLAAAIPLHLYRRDYRTMRQNMLSLRGFFYKRNPRWTINKKLELEGKDVLGKGR